MTSIQATFATNYEEGFYTIEFDDGSPTLYAPKEIIEKVEGLRIGFQNHMKELEKKKYTCHICSSDIFRTIYALGSEGKTLDEALTEEQKAYPWSYEILQEPISFFYPSSFKKIHFRILTEFSFLSKKNAQAILSGTEELSVAAWFANRRLRETIYFPDEQAALDYEIKLKQAYTRYWDSKRALAGKVLDPSEKEQKLEIKNEITTIRNALKKLKNSPNGLYNASRFVDHSNPFIREEAHKAKTKLDAYCTTIVNALRADNADMSRFDLLEHIIGPKNFLLSHYGIIPTTIQEDEVSYPSFGFIPSFQGTYLTEIGLNRSYRNDIYISFNVKTIQDLESHLRNTLQPKQFHYVNYDQRRIPELAEHLFSAKAKQPTHNGQATLPSFYQEDSLAQDNLQKLFKESKDWDKHLDDCYFSDLNVAESWLKSHSDEELRRRKKSPHGKVELAKHLFDDPHITFMAKRASRRLKAYRRCILSTLEKNEADLERKDLLDHLIGPKNYLFAYYGIVPFDKPQKSSFPFTFRPLSMNTLNHQEFISTNPKGPTLGYRLSNLGPKALEQEIRSDLAKGANQVNFENIYPKPFIEVEEISYPISEELKSLKAVLLPQIKAWQSLKSEEQDAVIVQILKFNDWDIYQINPKQIQLDFQNLSRVHILIEDVKGTLTLPNSKKMDISLNLWNFGLILQIPFHINPDHYSSKKYLNEKYAVAKQ